MSKFTAGPWQERQAGGFVDIIAANNDRVARVCEYGPQSDTPDAQAHNARLIAAAPELYAAIHAILEDAGYLSGEALPQLRELSVSRSKLDAARAALRKARGE
jgi:hypothetical protein